MKIRYWPLALSFLLLGLAAHGCGPTQPPVGPGNASQCSGKPCNFPGAAHECWQAKCLANPLGANVCEYFATHNALHRPGCRCVPNFTKPPPAGTSGAPCVCRIASSNETYWAKADGSPCSF